MDEWLELRLYGDLQEHFRSAEKTQIESEVVDSERSVYRVKVRGFDTVVEMLPLLGIKPDSLSHVFVNGTYAALEHPVRPGDRVALFPANMDLLYKQYFRKAGAEERG